MNTTEQKNQGYTAKEQELIRQLVQARMEQKAELGYEDLESYELPPRTQFSMVNKPAVSIKYREMTFNMACIRLFEGVQFILPFTSRTKRRLAVATCSEELSLYSGPESTTRAPGPIGRLCQKSIWQRSSSSCIGIPTADIK